MHLIKRKCFNMLRPSKLTPYAIIIKTGLRRHRTQTAVVNHQRNMQENSVQPPRTKVDVMVQLLERKLHIAFRYCQ